MPAFGPWLGSHLLPCSAEKKSMSSVLLLKCTSKWRVIALQYCVGLRHTSTFISCKCTHVPSFLNLPSHISHFYVHFCRVAKANRSNDSFQIENLVFLPCIEKKKCEIFFKIRVGRITDFGILRLYSGSQTPAWDVCTLGRSWCWGGAE